MELSVVISPDLRPNDKNKNRKRNKNLLNSLCISGPRPKALYEWLSVFVDIYIL